jgi:hypothetical protein
MVEESNNFLEGKVLVPKIGKDKEFHAKLTEIIKIAQGPLGWKGHAKMLHQLKAIPELENLTVEEMEETLKRAALQDLYEVGEWITEEDFAKREKSTQVLYGEPKV